MVYDNLSLWWQNGGKKKSEHARYLRNRSTARSFIRKQATIDDLTELKELIKERKEILLK
ncbi:hypothetical protein CUS77_10185 [Enterococcus faecium]|nr:hypothetical protein [Enterococcus faecium]PQF43843.1 hypothetical protein CUS77_10185 [Enterococcus faecium]